jgi:hypothetical protein
MPKKPKPGGSVFEPRAQMASPGSFGKVGIALEPADRADAQFDAAQFQHLLANEVRQRVLVKYGTLSAFLASSEMPPIMTYDRVSRILRGESMMTITDLLVWTKLFSEVQILAERLVAGGPPSETTSNAFAAAG